MGAVQTPEQSVTLQTNHQQEQQLRENIAANVAQMGQSNFQAVSAAPPAILPLPQSPQLKQVGAQIIGGEPEDDLTERVKGVGEVIGSGLEDTFKRPILGASPVRFGKAGRGLAILKKKLSERFGVVKEVGKKGVS